VTRSSKGTQAVSGDGQGALRRNWRKIARPAGLPIGGHPTLVGTRHWWAPDIGGRPTPIGSCPMRRHRAATVSTPDRRSNREAELTSNWPKGLQDACPAHVRRAARHKGRAASHQSSAAPSSSVSEKGSVMRSAISPAFCRIANSISSASAGLSRRNCLAFSRPWPSRWLL